MTTTSTCQHCDQPVTYGTTEGGFRGFVHVATSLAACPTRTFTIVVVGGAADSTNEFDVHRHDCADVTRRVRSGHHSYEVDAIDADAAVAAEVAEFEHNQQDWFASDFRILPCAR